MGGVGESEWMDRRKELNEWMEWSKLHSSREGVSEQVSDVNSIQPNK